MRPPKKPIFFIDRSLGKIDVPCALREAGHECRVHDDLFPQDTPDQEWMTELAKHKWIILTKDEKIRYRPLELQALKAAGLRVFIVICGNVRGCETAQIILKAIPRILKAALRTKRPFIFYVYKDSTIQQART